MNLAKINGLVCIDTCTINTTYSRNQPLHHHYYNHYYPSLLPVTVSFVFEFFCLKAQYKPMLAIYLRLLKTLAAKLIQLC